MKTTGDIRCRACGLTIGPEHLDARLEAARCPACRSLTDLREVAPARARPSVSTPGRFKVEPGPEGLRIRWRWFQPGRHLFLLCFCVAWDAFLLFWYGAALRAENTPWIMVVFPIAHVAVGVGLTYVVLAGLLNRTLIEVSRGRLTVSHGPLPWTRPPELLTRQIRQLFAQERVTRGEDSTTTRYDLCAVDREGRKVTLVSDLDAPDQALFLEQELEEYLGIPDQPVAGELARA